MTASLAGRTALITGATHGLGLEIARAYLLAGAQGVYICGRDRAALEAALDELRESARAAQHVGGAVADVADADAVQRLAADAMSALGGITILVSNAGVQGPKGALEAVDWREWVRTIEINLLGSVLVARSLIEHFKQRGYGKIVQLSGGGATAPMPSLSAYAASKSAVVRFAETLAVELRGHGVDVNALAPGALNTRMLDEVLEAGPHRIEPAYYERALQQQKSGGVPLARGAALAVFLGSAGSDGISGKLISAVWDPWTELSEHRDDLSGDVYTLRRIIPADRGLGWGDA